MTLELGAFAGGVVAEIIGAPAIARALLPAYRLSLILGVLAASGWQLGQIGVYDAGARSSPTSANVARVALSTRKHVAKRLPP
jgi:hypothetical protein